MLSWTAHPFFGIARLFEAAFENQLPTLPVIGNTMPVM